jgi:hypothetical protein
VTGFYTFVEAVAIAADPSQRHLGITPHLYTADNQQEDDFIYQLYGQYFWLGAMDFGTPGNPDVKWVSGPKSGEAIGSHSYWTPAGQNLVAVDGFTSFVQVQQPDNSGNKCILEQALLPPQVNHTLWALISCSFHLNVLLEYECPPNAQFQSNICGLNWYMMYHTFLCLLFIQIRIHFHYITIVLMIMKFTVMYNNCILI